MRRTIRSGGFVAPIAALLGPDGRWDGRSIALHVRRLVERPLRPQLDELPAGQIVTALAGPGGAATTRLRGGAQEPGEGDG